LSLAADLPGSSDPPGMKRYEGSEIIGYRAPKFEEFVLPLSPPTQFSPAVYPKSLAVEGLISRHTYIAPAGRSTAELVRNYKQEFQRLGLQTLYEKGATDRGWFGPTFEVVSNEDQLGQILAYNEAQERVIVAKSKDSQPTYYYVFVTAYRDGVIPERLEQAVAKDQGLVELIVIAPEKMAQRMTFVNAAEMSQSLTDTGRVILQGLYFDTDKDTIRPDSEPLLAEIAKLMQANPQLKVRVVGHTDNRGSADLNLDLSWRRSDAVVKALTAKYGIAPDRLNSFGCGLYAPVASNASEEGRAMNRRVELVAW
jgi:outer membrane protein OmpA-like peptidoglycan-associated protein